MAKICFLQTGHCCLSLSLQAKMNRVWKLLVLYLLLFFCFSIFVGFFPVSTLNIFTVCVVSRYAYFLCSMFHGKKTLAIVVDCRAGGRAAAHIDTVGCEASKRPWINAESKCFSFRVLPSLLLLKL